MSDQPDEPTIEIDSDWKAEAQREKERLLAEEERKKSKSGSATTDRAFVDLLNLLGMQASLTIGGYQGPDGEPIPGDLAAARQHISMLEALLRKTEGNLSDEEQRGLSELVHSLRMAFVKATEAAGGPAPGGAGPAGP
jgi:hypothetical protein